MKLQLVLHAISRYGSNPTVEDAACLHKKLEDWASEIVVANNYGNKHLGLHFRMEIVEVEVVKDSLVS